MKTIDEREMQKAAKEKQVKKEKGNRCKTSLILKSNLELALSIILQ